MKMQYYFKIFTPFISALLLTIFCFSQDVTITTQAEIDAFDPSITVIYGHLIIDGYLSNDPIINLDNLSNLTYVTYLTIKNNNSLTNIDGLSNITSIPYIDIGKNNSLMNIDALSNIISTVDLRVENNNSLMNIEGLSSVTSVDRDLTIKNNDSLTNIDSLSNLTSVGKSLSIFGNASLTNIDGLSNLTSVGQNFGNLVIRYNPSLTDCCGIQGLLNTPGAVGGNVSINNNPSECNNQTVVLNSDCSDSIFVDINASGTDSGDSWGNAFTNLQDALSAAQATNTIHIAEGTYLPSQNGTRGTSFDIPSEVTLLGGYPTGGGSANPDLYETILSGNVDNTSIQGDSYHVITIKDAVDIEINGITIRDGNANDPASYARSRGGGLYINNSTVELIDVDIKWNQAILGGAIFAKFSDITIIKSTFKKNKADYGAAFYYSNATNLNLQQTHVIDNTSNIRCALESNNASNTIIENCIFANNKSSNANALGFIATNRDASAQITNSTILGENANKNLISIQVGNNDQMDLIINNSIVAHQNPAFNKNIIAYNNNVFNFNHSNCYFSGASAIGNGTNNLFADVDGDLQLNADYSLANSSPAVNAGNDALAVGLNDIFGNPRFMGTVDIGAAENQVVPKQNLGNQRELMSKKHAFKVFPNPTSNFVSIDLGKDYQEATFTLRNILGQIIFNDNVNATDGFQFEINGVSGIYLLEIETETGEFATFRVLKN